MTMYRSKAIHIILPFSLGFRAPFNVRQTSIDSDEEELSFSPDEHKKRYKPWMAISSHAELKGLKWTQLKVSFHLLIYQHHEDQVYENFS